MQPFHTIAFYNTENLFDTNDDHDTLDRDFTPTGKRKWTKRRYEDKIGKLAMTISKIGLEETQHAPTLVGVAEVENANVMHDLINNQYLGTDNYDFVHYDSLDERGIDVGLIYNKNSFEVSYSEPLRPPNIYGGDGRDLTRDILYVKGKLAKQIIHLFVVHMPSKREENVNQPKRKAIAQMLRDKINAINSEDKNAYVIVLGDFNASPESESVKDILKGVSIKPLLDDSSLYNPMELLARDGNFTTVHRRDWLMFDQMLFSSAFFSKFARPTLIKTKVFNPYFLVEWNQRYKSQPFRTFVGRKYLGGYSDHFPIYSILKM